MSENRKRISIASTGPLITYGGIMGPIRAPFYETLTNISILISGGAEVYEHIGDKKIKLNMLNFDSDNSVEKVETTSAKAKEVSVASNDKSIIKISSNVAKAQQNQSYKNKRKENFYKEKVQPQVKEETVVDTIVEE